METVAEANAKQVRANTLAAQRQIRLRGAITQLAQSPAWEAFKKALMSAQAGKLREAMRTDDAMTDAKRRDVCVEARLLESIATMPDRAKQEILALEGQIAQQEARLREAGARWSENGGAVWEA